MSEIPTNANPLFGRQQIIDRIWKTLGKKSIYMNDLRRIGKTMILEAMKDQPREGWLVIKTDVGRTHSPEEFAALVYRESIEVLPSGKKAFRRMQSMMGAVAGIQVGPIKLPDGTVAPWKEVLEGVFSDLSQAVSETGRNAVFLWDEIPFLLDSIIKNSDEGDGEKLAMQVLDVIRSLGNDYSNVKVVITGSIGLHHILNELRQEDYINSPLNTMKAIAPGPLSESDGIAFAAAQFGERRIECAEGSAEELSSLVGHVPFYIENFIDGLEQGQTVDPDELTKILDQKLTDPDDDWDLPHYENRLERYYGALQPIALAILDELANKRVHQALVKLEKTLAESGSEFELEDLRKTLKLLHRDHYLDKNEKGRWAFRLAIVKRWWKLNRGL